MKNPSYLNITDAARMKNLSRPTIYRLIEDGQINTEIVGRTQMVINDKDFQAIPVKRSLEQTIAKLKHVTDTTVKKVEHTMENMERKTRYITQTLDNKMKEVAQKLRQIDIEKALQEREAIARQATTGLQDKVIHGEMKEVKALMANFEVEISKYDDDEDRYHRFKTFRKQMDACLEVMENIFGEPFTPA